MRTVFFDIDTQLDFVYPAGALYAPHADRIVPVVAGLNRFAAQHGFPVVSTVDAHLEDDIEFQTWPRHCVAGTIGQRKAESTLLERRVVVPNEAGEAALEGSQQIILEKQTVDAFATVSLQRVLNHLAADNYVIYGVVTEICVLHAARGLLKTGKSVTLVTDAVEALTAGGSAMALNELSGLGATLATYRQIVG
jgi:nicotinamidase/pyrazinamidase